MGELMRVRIVVSILLLGIGGALLFVVVKDRNSVSIAARTEQETQKFCAICHSFPQPELLPKSAWPEQVKLMYSLIPPARLWPPHTVPEMDEVIRYYTDRAPEQLEIRQASAEIDSDPIEFERRSLRYLPDQTGYGAVTHLQFVQLTPGGPKTLLVCDGRYGLVLAATPGESEHLKVLGAVPQPCHVQVIDLDRDGIQDILVASLGEFGPTDAKKGAVYWLKGDRRGGFQTIELISGLGRVSDVRAADFDGDGDLDLIIAEFGWRAAGGIIYAENISTDQDVPAFEMRRVDGRQGAVHIPIVDLNNDGRPDFLALLSQQYESVVAFINDGGANFTAKTIFDAKNPGWGSSGMEIVDMDGDGDWDVLLTNGDTFDNFVLKPYHGISWLENQGDLKFVHHPLTDMPAVYCAKACDLDGDGDLDIVACAYYAPPKDRGNALPDSIESLIWLEQISPGDFRRHTLERGNCVHLSLDAADWDEDGVVDLAVGVWPSGPYQLDDTKTWDWVTLLHNKCKRPRATVRPEHEFRSAKPAIGSLIEGSRSRITE
jgi:hypothetical protein